MARKEIAIPHEEIRNPQTITQINERKFKERGMSIHTNEVDCLEDDFKKGVRVLKVRNVTYIDMGRRGVR